VSLDTYKSYYNFISAQNLLFPKDQYVLREFVLSSICVKTSILRYFKRKGLTHTNSCVSNNGTVCAQTQSPLSLNSSSNGKSGYLKFDQWLRCFFLYQNELDTIEEVSLKHSMFFK